MLVFDTETVTNVGQGLLFGCSRTYRFDKHGPYLQAQTRSTNTSSSTRFSTRAPTLIPLLAAEF